jgi:hypothetical protein
VGSKAGLSKIAVERERFPDTQGPHDHEASAIGETPVLVSMSDHELNRPVVMNRLDPEEPHLFSAPDRIRQANGGVEAQALADDSYGLGEKIIRGHLPSEIPSDDTALQLDCGRVTSVDRVGQGQPGTRVDDDH